VNRRAFLLACVLAVVVGACVDALPERRVRRSVSIVLHGDTRFLPEERAAFERSARMWRAKTRGRVDVAFVWDLDEANLLRLRDAPRVIRVDALDPRTEAVDARLGPARSRAFVRPAGDGLPIIMGVVADRVDGWDATTMHEIGHLVGLPELPPGRSGVMNSENPGTVFTRDDDELIAIAGFMPDP
jgi:hypothetical protein